MIGSLQKKIHQFFLKESTIYIYTVLLLISFLDDSLLYSLILSSVLLEVRSYLIEEKEKEKQLLNKGSYILYMQVSFEISLDSILFF